MKKLIFTQCQHAYTNGSWYLKPLNPMTVLLENAGIMAKTLEIIEILSIGATTNR